MPELTERRVCAAPADEVWRLLHDPARIPDWWEGTERVEARPGEPVTRFLEGWPDFPMPTEMRRARESLRVVFSCLRSDIVIEWSLEPEPAGCAVRVHVSIPEEEARRLEPVREEVVASLARLARAAEAAALT